MRSFVAFAAAIPVAYASVLHAQDGLAVEVDDLGNYSVLVDGARWLQSGVVAFRVGGVMYTAPSADPSTELRLQSVTQAWDGHDPALGPFRCISQEWTPPSGSPRFETSFKVLKEHSAVIFEQTFPDGVDGAGSGKKHHVTTAFPAFRMEPPLGGFVLQAFAGNGQGTSSGNWSAGDTIGGGGVEGGSPLALYANMPQGGLRTVVLSPLMNHFVAGIASPEADLAEASGSKVSAVGLLASVERYPQNFTHQSILVAGHRVTDTFMSWGDALLAKGGKKRTELQHPTDLSLTDLGYWTDNGGWYHYLCSECCAGAGAQNPCPCPAECQGNTTMEDVMLQVKADWKNKGIPANYFMLDSWWYRKDGDPDPATQDHPWPVRTSGGVVEWVPEPNVFPSGLTKNFIGVPTFLHNRCFSPNNKYLQMPEFKNSFVCEDYGCLPQDEALFGHIMDTVKPWQPFVYEQDWLSRVTDMSTAAFNTTETGRKWLDSMNAAAVKRDITIQFSMSKTPQILHSTSMQAVTQIRASGDYVAGGSQWKTGQVALYYWALGVVASKDSFWTTKHQPGCPKAGDHNCTEPNVEVQLISAVLSGGPVGPADRLNLTDPVLALRSCTSGGKILRADRPFAPVDLVFARAAAGYSMDVLWATHTDRRTELGADAVWHYLFAAQLPDAGISVAPQDLLLPASEDAEFIAVTIVATGGAWSAVKVGADLQLVSGKAPLTVATPSGPSPLDCSGPSYCENDEVYCSGDDRKQTHEGQEDLSACQQLCDKDASCNCFSHADSPRKAGAKCRIYEHASDLALSAGGYNAYVKPTGASASGSGVVPFVYYLLAPRLRSGFAIVGELGKVVPASRQRICGMSGDSTLRVELCGVAGEDVMLAYVAPDSTTLAETKCVLNAKGRAKATCAAQQCACGTVELV